MENVKLDNASTNVNYDFSDIMAINDHNDRKLYINGEIDELVADEIVCKILAFNAEDKNKKGKKKPILLYCTSVGGSVIDGFSIIDAILNSAVPVYVVNLAYQYSMGFLIGLAGHKRYAMPNATFLLHDGQNMIWDSSAKCADQLKFQEKREKRIKDYVLAHSKLTEKQYDDNYRVDFYTFADEAKEFGFTDYIVGVDCSIEDIL